MDRDAGRPRADLAGAGAGGPRRPHAEFPGPGRYPPAPEDEPGPAGKAPPGRPRGAILVSRPAARAPIPVRPRLALPFTFLTGPGRVRLVAGEDFRYTLAGPG